MTAAGAGYNPTCVAKMSGDFDDLFILNGAEELLFAHNVCGVMIGEPIEWFILKRQRGTG
ncbi:MAG: hypothetical protein A2Z99_05695 [Treponema sp. GWB1_62_6]|nr:MAG: hypothetical protein A2Y36_03450 [Treponema sp. GWA1_62_8]OHE63547.1 MAG: hypothetical protein A2001_16700 [Treponema sp. GWC1_61_84]OHE70849.1 MAG: hypothetical protein A2Z99_05695 [Treponema sp. GWB1_62_6]OHE74757.1 MAG: hypothetical protein A2413_03350 [Treponema sp. RIFOXYC1_FULL_61_9]HCM28724.1 hypothetical protein [Treponema sp.]